jgi:hypothetical protein
MAPSGRGIWATSWWGRCTGDGCDGFGDRREIAEVHNEDEHRRPCAEQSPKGAPLDSRSGEATPDPCWKPPETEEEKWQGNSYQGHPDYRGKRLGEHSQFPEYHGNASQEAKESTQGLESFLQEGWQLAAGG